WSQEQLRPQSSQAIPPAVAVQGLILTAFEEENWPPHIDDPLPPAPEVSRKKRLNDTVFRLNEKQNNRLIRFESDRTGREHECRESGAGAMGGERTCRLD